MRSLVEDTSCSIAAWPPKTIIPPVAILDSLSRLMPAVVSPEHLAHAYLLRGLLAAYRRSEDLVRIGAYNRGADPQLDRAIALLPQLDSFLRQKPSEVSPLSDTLERFLAVGR